MENDMRQYLEFGGLFYYLQASDGFLFFYSENQ